MVRHRSSLVGGGAVTGAIRRHTRRRRCAAACLVVGVTVAGGLFASAAPAQARQADKPKPKAPFNFVVNGSQPAVDVFAIGCGLHGIWIAKTSVSQKGGGYTFGTLRREFQWSFAHGTDTATAKQTSYMWDGLSPLNSTSGPFTVSIENKKGKRLLVLDADMVELEPGPVKDTVKFPIEKAHSRCSSPTGEPSFPSAGPLTPVVPTLPPLPPD
jgi:hypothetical protein